jgi:elongation factor 1-beta
MRTSRTIMGTAAVQFKIMPSSPEEDLNKISIKSEEIITSLGGVLSNKEEEPIAFGLKALILSLAYPEEKEIEDLETKLKEIEGISSIEMIDYRRAIG